MDEGRDYSRGYLPHRDVPGATQFLTWRLHDALDAAQWVAWKAEYRGEERKADLYRRADAELDAHRGSAALRPPHIGRVVMETILAGHGAAYRVLAAVVMPNHVHAVLHVEPRVALGDVVKGIKGTSAREINRLLGREGRLWQPDYFDRLVRSTHHLDRCVGYVHWNPVRARLCDDPRRYPSSTANPLYAERLSLDENRSD